MHGDSTFLATGRTYHYVDQKSMHGDELATLLCLHGFPDLSHGWRNQVLPWAAQGYRVIVPDMLGYGKTDMPLEASAYTTKRLCDDLAALLDHLEVKETVVIGHDWGSFIASRFALWYPERLLALALLSLPYTPPSTGYMSLQDTVERHPSYGYQLYFASEQSAGEIEARLPLFFRLLFRAPGQTPTSYLGTGKLQDFLLNGRELDGCILNDKDLEYYVSNFQRGMIGPLSYYRTTKLRFEEEKDAALPSRIRSDLPVLFLYGTKDSTCSAAAVKNMGKFIDQLKVVPIAGIGHWVMIQASEAVTEEILRWLRSVLTPKLSTRM